MRITEDADWSTSGGGSGADDSGSWAAIEVVTEMTKATAHAGKRHAVAATVRASWGSTRWRSRRLEIGGEQKTLWCGRHALLR
eukprot:6213807-Pleurochrysis_carterae.AAC.3